MVKEKNGKEGKEAKARRVRKHTHAYPLRWIERNNLAGFEATIVRRLKAKVFGLRSWAALDFCLRFPGFQHLIPASLPKEAMIYAARRGYSLAG